MNSIELAQIALDYARTAVRDLVAQAYDAGTTSNLERAKGDGISKPESTEIEKALADLERRTVELARARMEETAKRCGFEGLTEAFGYLIRLRDNPVASLLREAVNLAALGDIDGDTEAYGWGHWYKRAKAAVGDTAPPPETINFDEELRKRDAAPRPVGMRPELAADFGPYMTGWPARPVPLDATTAEHMASINYAWDFYGLPRTRLIAGAPVYYWAGREGRPSRVPSWCTRRVGAEHVMVDEMRGDPAGAAPVCRIVESIEPLSLGHTLCISREELQPLEEGAWVPKHPAPGEPGCGNNPDCSCHGVGGTTTSKN